MPSAVSRVVQEFQVDTSLGMVYGASRLVDQYGHEEGFALSLDPNLWRMVYLADQVPQPSAFFTREAFSAAGELDETLRYCLDYELFIRMFARFPVKRIPEVLSQTRLYDETLSMSGGLDRYREIVGVVSRHSGRRFPPAIWNYAIDWFEHAVQRRVHRFRRRAVNRSILRALNATVTFGYYKVLLLSNPVYEDGWVGRTGRFLVRKGDGRLLKIDGSIPRRRARGSVQELEIRVQDVVLDRIALPTGAFSLLYSLPDEAGSIPAPVNDREPRAIDLVHSIVVRARWADRPEARRSVFGRSDRRSLSWRVDDIDVAREHAEVVPAPIGWFDDGWASPEVSVFIPPGIDEIRIIGMVPAEFAAALTGQTLRVVANGECVFHESLAIGAFEIHFHSAEERTVVHLRAAKWLETRDGESNEVRRLAYLLNYVGSDA